MLRSLVDEVVRRRLWPIPVVALLVAIAAPLLFMKSAPTNAPTEAPPIAAPGTLPKKADVLLKSSDRAVVSTKPSKRKAKDPFAPPAGSTSDASSAASGKTASAGTGSSQEVPVVIKNSDGTTSTATIAPSTGTSSSSKAKAKAKKTATKAKSTTPKVTVPKTSSSSAAATRKVVTFVDVQFGERMGTLTRYRVPRLQTFRAGGKVAAMFVKYSPTRNAAVFAVAPSTKVSGVTCREVKNVCRYVDLPEGAHARLKLTGADGSTVTRRIDVMRIRHLPKVPGTRASVRVTTMAAAKCLLKSLLTLSATAPSIAPNSCE